MAATYTQVVTCFATNRFKNVQLEDEKHKFGLLEYGRGGSNYAVILGYFYECVVVY